jgi:ubiquinone/menaquinone biosynthesis C-methylase UbiE
MPEGEPEFGQVADEYDAYRVGYTHAVWEHLERACGLRPGVRVLDVGCGNGLSATPLVERGADVVGVDPSATMLERAAVRLPEGVRLLEGRAEALPLADASFDIAVAAQSAHWFREPEASTEIRRVLRPGGSVVYLWKYPAPDTPYTYRVDELLVRLTGQAVHTIYGVGTVPELLGPGFEGYERRVFEQAVTFTIESYIGFVASRERVRQVAGEHRAELLEALREWLEQGEPSGAFVERHLVYVVSARRA